MCVALRVGGSAGDLLQSAQRSLQRDGHRVTDGLWVVCHGITGTLANDMESTSDSGQSREQSARRKHADETISKRAVTWFIHHEMFYSLLLSKKLSSHIPYMCKYSTTCCCSAMLRFYFGAESNVLLPHPLRDSPPPPLYSVDTAVCLLPPAHRTHLSLSSHRLLLSLLAVKISFLTLSASTERRAFCLLCFHTGIVLVSVPHKEAKAKVEKYNSLSSEVNLALS